MQLRSSIPTISEIYALSDLPRKAPKFPKKVIWLNVPEDERVKGFKGYVTLLDFWDYASISSIRELYYIKKWKELYEPLGLRVIGIHLTK